MFFFFLFSLFFLIAEFLLSNDSFSFQRDLILSGEWHRSFTFYFFHVSKTHWVINHLVFAALYLRLKRKFEKKDWMIFFTLSMIAISGFQLYFFEEQASIVGFSGLNYALTSLLLLSGWKRRSLIFSSLWFILLGKLILDFTANKSLAEKLLNTSVTHEQHLVGFIFGAFFYFFYQSRRIKP